MIINLAEIKRAKPKLEDEFEAQLLAEGIRGYERNARFIPGRQFQADFWFSEYRLCVEVDGGVFMAQRSGHTTGVGFHRDRVRDQLALANGIQTIRFTTPQIHNGEALQYLKAFLSGPRARVGFPDLPVFRGRLPVGYGESTKSKRGKK